MSESNSIYDIVKEALAEMGILESSPLVRTILLQDRCFIGEKFRFHGGYAVCLAGALTVEVYDPEGKPLTTIQVSRPDSQRAA